MYLQARTGSHLRTEEYVQITLLMVVHLMSTQIQPFTWVLLASFIVALFDMENVIES